MSNALAIAGVTAVLQDRLNDGLVNHNVTGMLGSTVTVSVLPPDRIIPADGSESSQLNLFLYQVTPNSGWRNEGLPSRDASGRERLTNPPLALDLHYLLSAYSSGDLNHEILLGYGMQLLHEFPVITREMINAALNPSPDVGVNLPPALRALANCGLADQVEQIRITPHFLNSEEMSKLWTAIQSHYRPSAAYQVSVVLIQAEQATRSPLPVLTRGAVNPASGRERGVVVTPSLIPPLPTIESVVPTGDQPVVRLGEVVTLNGHHLDGSSREIRLRNDRYDVDEVLAASGTASANQLLFSILTANADDFPVGVYEISAELIPQTETSVRASNRLACVIAPDVTNLPQTIARDINGDATVTINFTPALRPGQTVSLVLGEQEVLPEAFSAPVSTLDFIVRSAAAGAFLARLRIDGIDSPVVDRSTVPPSFFDLQVTIT